MKKNKVLLFVFTLIFAFFFSYTSVYAANVTVKGLWAYPSEVGSESFVLGKETKKLNDFSIFRAGDDHAYCIEPGARMTSTGYTNSSNTDTLTKYSDLTSAQKTLLSYVLTFAYKDDKPSEYSLSKYIKIAASQGLVWEVKVGDRTSFKTLAPDKNTSKKSFYYVIHNSSNANVKKIAQEYDRIVNAVKGAFINGTGETGKVFTTKEQAKKVAMVWDSSLKKYTLTINDTDFKYWTAEATQNGLSVKVDSNKVTITSSTSIDEASAKEVKISVKNSNGANAVVYKDSYYQDVVTIGGTSINKYIKVYTPKYQLKITKKASLDGKVLSGAKFKVCSDDTCSNAMATITTDSNGVATYDKLPNPGTYHVQEISAPKGYETDSTVYPVSVTKSNIAGTTSYGTKTITNKNKEFNLTKKTKDENEKVTILDDGCGTEEYTGPEFEILENGKALYFKEINAGEYNISNENDASSTTKLKTCNGEFKVYTLPNCNYTISEVKAPDGLTLPANPTKSVNICDADKNVSFTNGFTGLEFQKKDEDGNFIAGGKFTLQIKVNNIYKDVLLKEIEEGYYEYSSDLTESDEGAAYIFKTTNEVDDKGKAYIKGLSPGEYRVIEKEAPEGYDLIKDKDSTALVTIKDSNKDDYYLVELVNQKSNQNGSEASAELVVTITTGRKVPNYVFIISALAVLLIVMIILRKKLRK